MKKSLRIISSAALALMVLMLTAILSFYILIVAGASPKLQTIWICSAMRTMSHQYLATAFFSDEYIDSVIEANEVDDSGHDSDILDFSNESPDPEENANIPITETEEEQNPDEPQETEETEIIEETSAAEEETVPPAESETVETAPETEEASEENIELKSDYIAEGYEMLEEGLYLKEVSGLTWRGFVMLVEDPMRVKLTDTSQQYVCGENVMTMTKNAGAVAGINGGGFTDGPNYDSNGGYPAGLIIEDGDLVWPLEPDETVYNMIGINRNGALVLRHCTAQWALENDIVSAVSFSPFIVVNGEGLVTNGTGGWGIAPRTAIGQRKTGEFLLLVIDGRQADWSIGCDLDVLQEVMLEENAYNAAMLDGGSSTAMVYNGEYINRPSLGHERWINNCFVVMPNSSAE